MQLFPFVKIPVLVPLPIQAIRLKKKMKMIEVERKKTENMFLLQISLISMLNMVE